MTGHIIRNTGSGVSVELPTGETVQAASVIEALGMVAKFRDPRTVEGPDVAFETEKHMFFAPEVTHA